MIGLPRWCSGKESTASGGDTKDTGSIIGPGRSPEAGNGNPHQCSCLENPMDKGAWLPTIGSERVGHDCDSVLTHRQWYQWWLK